MWLTQLTDAERLQLIASALLAAERRGAQQQWQPIETAPKDGTRVWLWNGYRRCIGWYSEYADHSGGWHRQSLIGEGLGKRDIDPETHWMPLPSPPPAQEP